MHEGVIHGRAWVHFIVYYHFISAQNYIKSIVIKGSQGISLEFSAVFKRKHNFFLKSEASASMSRSCACRCQDEEDEGRGGGGRQANDRI